MPAVARKGDLCTTGHGCDTITSLTDPTGDIARVYANNIGIECLGNPTVPHLIDEFIGDELVCVSHVAFINTSSPNVFISNIPVSRVTDSVDSGVIISGSPNVFIN